MAVVILISGINHTIGMGVTKTVKLGLEDEAAATGIKTH
jgi:hypothetical protein